MNELIRSILDDLWLIYPDGEVTIRYPFASAWATNVCFARCLPTSLLTRFKFSSHRPKRMIEIGCVEEISENTYFVKDNGAGFDMQQ